MILDASAAAPLLLPDEGEPSPELSQRVIAGPLVVPQHWSLEVAGLLRNAAVDSGSLRSPGIGR